MHILCCSCLYEVVTSSCTCHRRNCRRSRFIWCHCNLHLYLHAFSVLLLRPVEVYSPFCFFWFHNARSLSVLLFLRHVFRCHIIAITTSRAVKSYQNVSPSTHVMVSSSGDSRADLVTPPLLFVVYVILCFSTETLQK